LPVPAGRTDRHVIERGTGLGAAADPLTHDIVALGDQVSGAFERQVRERRPELRGERAHLLAVAARCVQRVLETDVGCSELVDDCGVEVRAPELGEPASDDGLVLLDRHSGVPFLEAVVVSLPSEALTRKTPTASRT